MNTLHVALEEAVKRLLARIDPIAGSETVPLAEAPGRVAARDRTAAFSQPPFDRSPLDGYAFDHRSVAGASPDSPVSLRVAQKLYAGDGGAADLRAGEAARVMTGSMLPGGADCVIRQEETEADGDRVVIRRELKAHENYVFAGEDIKAGELLFSRGERLGYAHAGLLAAQGFASAEVLRRPCVGLLTSGNELLAPGEAPAPGKIFNSNQALLSARLRELGALVCEAPIQADTPDGIARAVEGLFARCDLVVTTGGVSVGERDCMPAVVDCLGAALLFHGLDMKPGSPALAFEYKGKIAICLSGNPFAAAATFELLAVPALAKLSGRRDVLPVRCRGVAAGAFGKASPGRRLIRARMIGAEVFIPGGGHSSGQLASLIGCNCLVDIPAGSPPICAGDAVEVILLA